MSDDPTGPNGPGFIDRLRAALGNTDHEDLAEDAADAADRGIAGQIKRLRQRRAAAKRSDEQPEDRGIAGQVKRLRERRQQQREERRASEGLAARAEELRRRRATPSKAAQPPMTGLAARAEQLRREREKRERGVDRGRAAEGERPEDLISDEDRIDMILSGTSFDGAPWQFGAAGSLLIGNPDLVGPLPDRESLNKGIDTAAQWVDDWQNSDWATSGAEYSLIAIADWSDPPTEWRWAAFTQSTNAASTLHSA